jgi:hypothetical protein
MSESVLNDKSADIELTKLNKNDSFESKSNSETDESRYEHQSSKKSNLNELELTSKVN